MSKPLTLAMGLALPLDVATQKLAWIGTTGSGKTYGALKLAELMWHAGIQFAAIDTMGIWFGLRLRSDGVNEGIPVTVFGGQHGDLPIRPVDGALIAEVIVHEGISAVIDVSGFETDADKARFASDFADRLYRLKTTNPSAIHLFLEEAHEFIPQSPMGNETMMLHHFNRIWKQGRNFGIGGSIITQRPQDVAKKSLELSAAVFAFNTSGSNTLDAMVKWLRDVPDVKDLPKLPMGKDAEFMLYSPSWLNRHGRFKILPRETFHASYDPYTSHPVDTGDRRLAPVAVDRLREAMAIAVDEAEENDPVALKKKITALEKQLEGMAPSMEAITEAVEEATRPIIRRTDYLELVIQEAAETARNLVHLLTVQANAGDGKPLSEPVSIEEVGEGLEIPQFIQDARDESRPSPVATDEPQTITKPQQAILDTLATLKAIGLYTPQRSHVALFAGVSPLSSGFEKNLSSLRSKGLIDYPEKGKLILQDDGAKLAARAAKPPTRGDLHRAWCAQLSRPQAAILKVLIPAFPKPKTREFIADSCQVSVKSSGFEKNLSRLRSLGLVDYPAQGSVVATKILFPEGLK